MKLFIAEPRHLVRIQIVKLKQDPQYITFCDTTPKEVESFIKKIITKEVKVSPFDKGLVTSVHIRESWGGKNGKSKSISFRGMEPKELHDLIIKQFENETN